MYVYHSNKCKFEKGFLGKINHIFIRILDYKINVIFSWSFYNYVRAMREGGRAFTFPTFEAEKLEINCTQYTCTPTFPRSVTSLTRTYSLSLPHTHFHTHALSRACKRFFCQLISTFDFMFLLFSKYILPTKNFSSTSDFTTF